MVAPTISEEEGVCSQAWNVDGSPFSCRTQGHSAFHLPAAGAAPARPQGGRWPVHPVDRQGPAGVRQRDLTALPAAEQAAFASLMGPNSVTLTTHFRYL